MDSIIWGMVKIISDLPIKRLIDIQIDHVIQEHSQLRLKAIIESEDDEKFLDAFHNKQIRVVDLEYELEGGLLFAGKVKSVKIYRESQLTFAEIDGVSYTYELDIEKKQQSFQNLDLTYEDVVKMVLQGSKARYLWNVKEAVQIERPFIQYDETDWQFLSRLVGCFNAYLQVSAGSDRADFHFGVSQGSIHDFEIEKLTEYGFNQGYCEYSGCQEDQFQGEYRYIKLKDKSRWRIGDFTYYKDRKYMVYQEHIQMEGSNLYYYHTLGMAGFIHQSKSYNSRIAGLRLAGTIKKVDKDNLFIQFDIDKENRADYKWPWVPIVSNMGYFMPEAEEKVLVFFSDEDEGNGQAVELLRDNKVDTVFEDPANKEVISNNDKTLALHPDTLLLKGRGGIPAVSLSDDVGILMNSNGGIHFNARDEIIVTSREIQMQAPQKVVLQTAESNIELCRDINFYAPGGVSRNSKVVNSIKGKHERIRGEQSESEHWQLSYGAIGAIPSLDCSTISDETFINMVACGTIPKFGKGSAVVSISQVQEGKRTKDTAFPHAFNTMANYTLKGGRPLPKEDMKLGGT